jgi:hypothetical protein
VIADVCLVYAGNTVRALFPGAGSYPLDSERGVADVDPQRMERAMQAPDHQVCYAPWPSDSRHCGSLSRRVCKSLQIAAHYCLLCVRALAAAPDIQCHRDALAGRNLTSVKSDNARLSAEARRYCPARAAGPCAQVRTTIPHPLFAARSGICCW